MKGRGSALFVVHGDIEGLLKSVRNYTIKQFRAILLVLQVRRA